MMNLVIVKKLFTKTQLFCLALDLAKRVDHKVMLGVIGVLSLMSVSVSLHAKSYYSKPEYRGPGRYVDAHHIDHSRHSRRSRQRKETIDYAKVVHVEPLSRTVRVSTPQRECWQEKVAYRTHRAESPTGAILGGIIGAAVGNELGHRNTNKKVGAVAGALLGSSIGNDITRKNRDSRVSYNYEEKCKSFKTYHEEERIDGYLVEYRYRGQTYTTRMQSPPGDRLKVRVHVSPII